MEEESEDRSRWPPGREFHEESYDLLERILRVSSYLPIKLKDSCETLKNPNVETVDNPDEPDIDATEMYLESERYVDIRNFIKACCRSYISSLEFLKCQLKYDRIIDQGKVSSGEHIRCWRNGVVFDAVIKDVDHAAKTVTLIESLYPNFTDAIKVKLSFREFFELGFIVGRRKARTKWHHNQLYIMGPMHNSLSYNCKYSVRKSKTLRHIENRTTYDNSNRPIGTKRPSHQNQSETIQTHKEGNKSGYERPSNSESYESLEIPSGTLKTSSETLCLQSPVSKFNVNIQVESTQLKATSCAVLPSQAVLLAMCVAAAMLPYIAMLVGNLTSVQRTYAGLWRPNELCDY